MTISLPYCLEKMQVKENIEIGAHFTENYVFS